MYTEYRRVAKLTKSVQQLTIKEDTIPKATYVFDNPREGLLQLSKHYKRFDIDLKISDLLQTWLLHSIEMKGLGLTTEHEEELFYMTLEKLFNLSDKLDNYYDKETAQEYLNTVIEETRLIYRQLFIDIRKFSSSLTYNKIDTVLSDYDKVIEQHRNSLNKLIK